MSSDSGTSQQVRPSDEEIAKVGDARRWRQSGPRHVDRRDIKRLSLSQRGLRAQSRASQWTWDELAAARGTTSAELIYMNFGLRTDTNGTDKFDQKVGWFLQNYADCRARPSRSGLPELGNCSSGMLWIPLLADRSQVKIAKLAGDIVAGYDTVLERAQARYGPIDFDKEGDEQNEDFWPYTNAILFYIFTIDWYESGGLGDSRLCPSLGREMGRSFAEMLNDPDHVKRLKKVGLGANIGIGHAVEIVNEYIARVGRGDVHKYLSRRSVAKERLFPRYVALKARIFDSPVAALPPTVWRDPPLAPCGAR